MDEKKDESIKKENFSTADELIKFKKLLDDGVISQEEFEKQKNELLKNEEKNETNKKVTSNDNKKNVESKKAKNPSGCSVAIAIIVGFIVFCSIFGAIIDSLTTPVNTQKVSANQQLLESNGITNIYEIDETLKKCGFSNYTITRDESGDNVYVENSMCFIITENKTNYDNMKEVKADLILKDSQIYSINLLSLYPLYENNEHKGTVQDFAYTFTEKSNAKTTAMNTISKTLKAPSTAKYAGLSEWTITKSYGEWHLISYVDSQNGFGAMIRSTFEIKFTENELTYLVIDGQQYK